MVNMQRVRRIRMLIYGFLLFVFLAPLIITITIFFQMLRLEAAFQEQLTLAQQAEVEPGTAQAPKPPSPKTPAEKSSSVASSSSAADTSSSSPEEQQNAPPESAASTSSSATPAAQESTAPGAMPLSDTPPVNSAGEPAIVPSSHPYTGG